MTEPIRSTSPITLTASAAAKISQLILDESIPETKLRVFVQGGGCSGLQYGFCFDEIMNDDDILVTQGDTDLLIDVNSFQYLEGATIDYVDDLDGTKFVIKNPNATTTCGCGSSFSL